MSGPGGPDRNKRPKAGEGLSVGPLNGGAYGHVPPSYGGQPPHFQPAPPYGNQQQYPPMQYGGHMQYGGQQSKPTPPPGFGPQPPPQMWGNQQAPTGPPPSMGVYRPGGGPSNGGAPDRAGYHYRSQPQIMQGGQRGRPGPASQSINSNGPGNSPSRGNANGPPAGNGPPGSGYWPGQQWPQHKWGGPGPLPPAPLGWQGGPPMAQPGHSPPPSMPQHMQPMSSQQMWSTRQGNGMASPGRQQRGSPEARMSGYSQPMSGMLPEAMGKPLGMDGSRDVDMYVSRGLDDASSRSKMSQADKDKGRGSYRCGRCGAPKKGHVCPYQPKLKRRPDEPPPVMRNAALQVEMDEFMTLRRLNIEIQGFPESYATAPHMADNMVVGEPHPLALASMPEADMVDLSMAQVHPGEHENTEPQPEEMRSSPRGSLPEVADVSN